MDNNLTNFKRLVSNDETEFLKHLSKTETKKKRSSVQKMKDSLIPGLSIGLINYPMSIALAAAAGISPSIGVLTAVISGIIHGLSAGSNYNIMGPSLSLSGFITLIVLNYGEDAVPYFALITGFFVILFKSYHLDRYIDLFPNVVIDGFTIGIACIIFFNQLDSALGIDIHNINLDLTTRDKEHLEIMETPPEMTLIHRVVETILNIHNTKLDYFVLYANFLLALVFLNRMYPKMPWYIITSIVGILIGSTFPDVETLSSRYSDFSFKIINLHYLKSNNISPFIMFDIRIYIDSIPIVFWVILETLITAKMADKITETRFNTQNELRGLAISNIITGLFGGFSVNGSLTKTILNIQQGGNHRYVNFVNAIVVLVCALILTPFFKYLPVTVLAAQVCCISLTLIDFDELRNKYERNRKNFIITMIVAFLIIITDPMIGVIFGMFIYLIQFTEKLIQPWTEIIVCKDNIKLGSPHKDRNSLLSRQDVHLCDIPKFPVNFVVYRIVGIMNFINVNKHIENLTNLAIKTDATVIISLRYMHYIDSDAIQALKLLIDKTEKHMRKAGVPNERLAKVLISGVSESKYNMLHDDKWIRYLREKNAVILNESFAIKRPSLFNFN